MPYDPQTGTITWRIHLASSRRTVFEALTSDEGRSGFWAESTSEADCAVTFRFPNGMEWTGTIFDQRAPDLFALDYFGSRVEFRLEEDGRGGTDLTLIDEAEPDADRYETLAGWVSVLVALKAAVDHGVDLRNHDPDRHWDHGYVDN
jgi:uncharacterized protein YndB with AHSA1/START domain